ncbi:MAG TPA: SPW repeat protein [Desulfuromonadales bacterium]|nr:SPW repeat protein [Desulfuromonadales bacterium]
MGSKRVIDWINLLLGAWLIISPWVLGTVASTTSTILLVLMGIALVAFSVWALVRVENQAAEWWNFFLGALLFFLPWIFSYTSMFSSAVNSWIVGVVVAVLALITMPLIKGMHHEGEHHHA